MPRCSSLHWHFVLVCCWAFTACGFVKQAAAQEIRFSRDILPILSDNCFYCHGPDSKHREADLRLDDEAAAKLVTDGKGAIVPGNRGMSELVRRITSQNAEEVMPPPHANKKLTPQQIELLGKWIDAGAPWGVHWAFEKPERAKIVTDESGWARGLVDAFVKQGLSKEGLQPSEEADKRTLLRRATLELTGLPPSVEEVEAFVSDDRPDAYERQVDRLLASQAYGERMSWEWLEAARYADSNGYQGDGERTMWPWRDWVASALNQDLPFDEFTIWQLAGDQLPGGPSVPKMASGFLRNHAINGEGGRIAEENRVDYVMDMSETVGTVWLGLTMNCCRCHDHKFDPLTNRDYYALTAFFNQTPVNGGGGDPQQPPNMEVASPEQLRERERLNNRFAEGATALEMQEKTLFPREDGKGVADSPAVASLPENVRKALQVNSGDRSPAQLEELEKHFAADKKEYAELLKGLRQIRNERDGVQRSIPRVMVMEDMPAPRKTFILEKGLYDKPKDEITAAVPVSLPKLPEGEAVNRLALAKWLVAKENPLTARVTVNRFWQQVFGIGLVKTVEDFGVQAETPRYADLLDSLAVDFQESGWQMKRLMRKMVTSATYRQSSKATKELVERDPANRMLARGPRVRMPSWMIRDQALSVSGLLVQVQGGKPVQPYQPAGIWEEATFGNKKYNVDQGASLYRRSMYTFWRRIVGPTMFFDTPARSVCSVKQVRTNTPLHALATLNDVTYAEAARVLAAKVQKEVEGEDQQVRSLFRTILLREPRPNEQEILVALYGDSLSKLKSDPESVKQWQTVGSSVIAGLSEEQAVRQAALASVAVVVMNTDEAVTKE